VVQIQNSSYMNRTMAKHAMASAELRRHASPHEGLRRRVVKYMSNGATTVTASIRPGWSVTRNIFPFVNVLKKMLAELGILLCLLFCCCATPRIRQRTRGETLITLPPPPPIVTIVKDDDEESPPSYVMCVHNVTKKSIC